MSRRSQPYDWLGIETAFSGRNVEDAVQQGIDTLPKFDPVYFRTFVNKIKDHLHDYSRNGF